MTLQCKRDSEMYLHTAGQQVNVYNITVECIFPSFKFRIAWLNMKVVRGVLCKVYIGEVTLNSTFQD